MAKTKVHPLSEIADEVYVTIPFGKDQWEAFLDAITGARAYERLRGQLGVEEADHERYDALQTWLLKVTRMAMEAQRG